MTNRAVAFVTSAELSELTADDRVAAAGLRSRGVPVRPAVWDDPTVDWRRFAAIVLRSCWDYHLRPREFRAWLNRLDELDCTTWNATATARWNLDKSYLAKLAERGLPVVPTVSFARGCGADLGALMDERGWDEVVIKPRIGASAHGTWRAAKAEMPEAARRLAAMPAAHGVLVQPLVEEVLRCGEWSLVYVDGAFSHAVLKRTRDGDFRVQVGGTAERREPSEALVAAAERVLAAVEPGLLYARVDMVEAGGGGLLMELELLEPDLFFRLDPGGVELFCAAVERRLRRSRP